MQTKTNQSRNSLLELLRLCASLWVMYYHGLTLIPKTTLFANGRIAVDFFFILSGFFFLNTYQKEKELPFFKGLLTFIWKRFKPLIVTFLICEVFAVLYWLNQNMNGSIWGYLWYVPHLLCVLSIYFILRYLIKNDIIFYLLISIITIISYGFILSYVVNYGIIRGLAGIGMGILISRIPKLHFKYDQIINLMITILLFIIITLLAIISPIKQIQDPVCLLILFPLIIYFASNVNYSSNLINNICQICFGLYAYQTIPRYLQIIIPSITDGVCVAVLVFVLAALDVLIKKAARRVEIQ